MADKLPEKVREWLDSRVYETTQGRMWQYLSRRKVEELARLAIEESTREKDREIAELRKEPAGWVVVPREPTEAMVDAPRQIILYSGTRGRSLEGLREHLDLAGVEFHSWFPEWAITECGHLTKGAIAILVYRAMLAAKETKE